MSKQHPIVAITGASGAGTTLLLIAFKRIFRQEGIHPAILEGDGFHRYDRKAMDEIRQKSGRRVSHFSPEGNLLNELAEVFEEYARCGRGRQRHYVHNEEEAIRYGSPAGTLTQWEPLPEDTDLLFYEGLHGGLVNADINIARHVDLLIGVAPIINLEWIQKIHRDKTVRGYTKEGAVEMILTRMHDYVHYILPQFSQTHLNLQRVPTVDSANPFDANEVPTNDQSFSIMHVRDPVRLPVDFPFLLQMLPGSFMSAPDTIVVPASKKVFAIQLLLTPVLLDMVAESRRHRRHRLAVEQPLKHAGG